MDLERRRKIWIYNGPSLVEAIWFFLYSILKVSK